jgi:hypothetical protein
MEMKIQGASFLKTSKFKSQRGAVVVLVAISLVVLLGFTALAIDLGYRHVVKNELQDIADAAALAAANKLGSIYGAMDTTADQLAYNIDDSGTYEGRADIVEVAVEVGAENKAGNTTDFVINTSDVEIGHWDWDKHLYCDSINSTPPDCTSPSPVHPTAVRVTARRDSAANGPISTFFAKIFGMPSLKLEADATAALGNQVNSVPEEIQIPVAISKAWLDSHPGDSVCGSVIAFSPPTDPDACAGWTTFTDSNINDPLVQDYIDGTKTSPALNGNTDTLRLINGNLSNPTFSTMLEAFGTHGYDVDRMYDPSVPYDPSNEPQPIYRVDDEGHFVDADGNPVATPEDNPATDVNSPQPLEDADGNQLYYPDGNPRYFHEWKTTVPVYDSDECNPNQTEPIYGFARVIIYDVGNSSDKTVKARIDCGYVDPNPTHGGPGGGPGTILGSLSGLVE